MGITNRNQAEAEFERGMQLMEANQMEEATKAFRQAIRLDPQSDQGYVALATTLGMTGKSDEAIATLKNALKITQDNPITHLSLGTLYNERGEFAEAQRATERALKLYTGMAYPMGIVPNDLPEPDPLLSTIYLNLADSCYNQELYEKAESHYSKALKANPEDLRAQINLGLTLSQLSRYEESADVFKKIAETYPQDADIHNHLGIQYLMMDQLEEAKDEFLAHLELNPDDAETCDTLGSIYHDLGDNAKGLEFRRRAAKLAPKNVDYLVALAWSQHQMELYEISHTTFKKAVAMDPENLIIQCMQAEASALAGSPVRAKRFERVKPQAQESTDLLVRIGRAYFELGDDEEAIQAYNTAIALKPEDPYAHYWLGMLYLDSKQIMQARLKFDEVLKLDPENEDAHYSLGLLAQETKDKVGVEEECRLLRAMDSIYAQRLQEILDKWVEA